ncbi:hypothetical protein V7S43_011218 [Phytophthora oleae]|uniref:Uncharacterized protein n=1 Tax=Phytophthora oleae TaxID=2107226 RepID=A0ABD3FE83_9STRA
MAPKISLALGFQEQHKPYKNPSILSTEEDYFDEEEDWDTHVKPRRRSSSVEAALNSCFTSLSSSLNAVTDRATKLYSRESSRRCGQRRSSMIEVPSDQEARSLERTNSMPVAYRSSESDLDLFGGADNGTEDPIEICLSKMEVKQSPSLFKRLLPTRSWTLGSKKTEK